MAKGLYAVSLWHHPLLVVMSSNLSKIVSVFSLCIFSVAPAGLSMHDPKAYGNQYQADVVKNAKIKQSISLCHFLVQILPLTAFTLEFTLMKKGPRRKLNVTWDD